MVKSLKEYGLSNSSVNDTPTLFSWGDVEKSPLMAYKNVRIGFTSFGYVKTRDEKEFEGGAAQRSQWQGRKYGDPYYWAAFVMEKNE